MEENKIIEAVLQNREDIQNIKNEMMTRKDYEQVIGVLDEIKGIVKNTNQEMAAMGHRVGRAEGVAEQNKTDIQTIKPLVGLV